MTSSWTHPPTPASRKAHAGRALLAMALAFGLIFGIVGQAQAPSELPPEARQLATRAVDQLSVAIREAVFAWPASEVNELRPRAARMLNVIVGQSSRHHQSEVGDPPGADGVGILTYLERLREVIRSHAQGANRARQLLFSLEIGMTFSQEAQRELLDALRTRDADALRGAVRRALAFLSAARGTREDPLSEGGVRALLAQLETL